MKLRTKKQRGFQRRFLQRINAHDKVIEPWQRKVVSLEEDLRVQRSINERQKESEQFAREVWRLQHNDVDDDAIVLPNDRNLITWLVSENVRMSKLLTRKGKL